MSEFAKALKIGLENQDAKQDSYSNKLARKFAAGDLANSHDQLRDPYVLKKLTLEELTEDYGLPRGVRLGCYRTRKPVSLETLTKFKPRTDPWSALVEFLSGFNNEVNFVFTFDTHGDQVPDVVITDLPPYNPIDGDWHLTVCLPDPIGTVYIMYLKTFLRNTWNKETHE